MTKRTEKKAATKTTKTTKEPKRTKTEQAEVKEQLGALIADATQTPTPADATVPPAAQPEAPASVETKKEPKAKAPRKPRANASAVESPVALVHATCNEMLKANPQLTRKDVMAALLAKGINKHTISTQWQRWNAARKAQ